MKNTIQKGKVAWITVPAYISTDRFIIPELSKYYNIDWYLITKNNEEIDFLDNIQEMKGKGILNLIFINIPFRDSDPRVIGLYSKFLSRIKAKNYDMIYNVMLGIPYYMPTLRLKLGSENVLVAIHNVHVPKGGTKYLFSKMYTTLTINMFYYFQTFSESQKKELLALAPKKYCDNVSFLLMDYGKPNIIRTNKEITLLSFGFIRDYKRIDTLIVAAQRAYKHTGKFFKVIIAGSCDNWEKYANLITIPDLFDLRIGRIKDAEIPNLFAETDYFIAPYQDIAQSGSAVIAVNYEKPIIASKLEAFEDYVIDGETGFLIKPADADELTEKLCFILKNHSAIYDILIKNIKTIKKEKFSANSIAKMYIKNFETVMNRYKY